MKEYFNEYKKFTVSKKFKLNAYTIDHINDITQSTDKFSFHIDYSVKPSNINSDYWIAGNGVSKGSWIVNKSAFIYVEKVNNEYKLTSIGTGP